MTLLAIVLEVIGWSLSSFWFQVGPYGRLFGGLVALAYFASMDSRLGGGQTLGKRALDVAIRSESDEAIGAGRATVRTLVWLVPTLLNGWSLPVLLTPIVLWVDAVVLFGVGGAVVLTMVFNRRSGQGLQDLVTGTYAVRLKAGRTDDFPVASRAPWVLTGVAVGLAAIVGVVVPLFIVPVAPLRQLVAIQDPLQRDPRFFSAGVSDQTFIDTNSKKSRILMVQLWYRGAIDRATAQRVVDDVARTVIATPRIGPYDLVRVDVTSAFDLGLATGHVSWGDGETIDVWRTKTASGQPSSSAP